MNTPIYDFIKEYNNSGTLRLHVPGHKGQVILGPEPYDLTELKGADSLYEASGIIAESERNASTLFGTAATFYSAEGSSLCIRAMLRLLLTHRPKGASRTVCAARNVHKSFVYAAALLDFEVEWLYGEETGSVISCPVTAASLEATLKRLTQTPAAVYVTSPDYLGNMQDIAALAAVCHRYGTRLAVDNAHGAYLHFLPENQRLHPLDLGADICCDSAHKTLPVLTGGAYLHLAASCPADMISDARSALGLFGSTSPSYLILASLDLCNRYLEERAKSEFASTVDRLNKVKKELRDKGWTVPDSDPLRLTLKTDGVRAAQRLRAHGIEPEYTDTEFVVMMITPFNTEEELDKISAALEICDLSPAEAGGTVVRGTRLMSIAEALREAPEQVKASEAVGRICAEPSVACPPAVPVVMPGERIEREHLALFEKYGTGSLCVVRER